MSPTVLQSGPYRFFFFSSDYSEPPHVHVARERKAAKFWLPVRLAYNRGFAQNEVDRITARVQGADARWIAKARGSFVVVRPTRERSDPHGHI